MLPTMQGFVEDVIHVSQGWISMSTEGVLRIGGARGVRSYLAVLSTSRRISVPAAKLLCKYINPKGRRYLILASLTNRSHQVDLRILRGPCLIFKILCKMKLSDQC